MELKIFMHSWIPCCGFSGNLEMYKIETSYQASGLLPALLLYQQAHAFARRELNHFLAHPRTTSSAADSFRDSWSYCQQ